MSATSSLRKFLPVWLGLTVLMSGAAKASNEVVIVGLNSNRVLSGVVEIPVELHATTEVTGVYFLLDGEPSVSIMNPRSQPPKPPILGQWFTTKIPNGWYSLQAFAEYPDPATFAQAGYSEYNSPKIRVRVFNSLMVDIGLSTYGDMDTGVPFAFPINAVVAATNAAWKVTISTELNQVLCVRAGVTTNGIIETTWDGRDLNGTRIRPPWVDFEVEANPTDGSPKAVEHRRATLEGRLRRPDGQGTETFPDGSKYVGEFKNGRFNGQGTWTSPDGSEQRGEWKDGEPYRVTGIDISPDGTKEVGTWNYNGAKSSGTITWKDGREYKGDWKIVDGGTDLPDGAGKMTYPDGKVEDGLWKDGQFEGASISP